MRLYKARIRKYRSIFDTGEFEIEKGKTILVGPNEAGKTVILQALQQLNAPKELEGFEPLRDYPRSEYNKDLMRGAVDPDTVTVVEGHFELESGDLEGLPEGYEGCTYVYGRKLVNRAWHSIDGGPSVPTYGALSKDLTRLCAYIDKRKGADDPAPSVALTELVKEWNDSTPVEGERAAKLRTWLEGALPLIEEESKTEEERYDRLLRACKLTDEREAALAHLAKRLPRFVLFNNYFRVRPRIHLEHLAERLKSGVLDDQQYDYGNLCLLKLLGFTAKELADLGNAPKPEPGDAAALKAYQDKLDRRDYQLNAASVSLTDEIVSVWNPNPDRSEASKLRIKADGQYLKVGQQYT